MISIVPSDPNWPALFTAEGELLRGALGPHIVRLDHVGSTSVPGLAAKPVIDIQISVQSLDARETYAVALAAVGYSHVPDADVEFEKVYPFFRKPACWPTTHHVHLCVAGSDMERRTLAFRDYLRDHKDVAAEYLELKRRLTGFHQGATAESRERYALAKDPFVTRVVELAFEAGYPKRATVRTTAVLDGAKAP